MPSAAPLCKTKAWSGRHKQYYVVKATTRVGDSAPLAVKHHNAAFGAAPEACSSPRKPSAAAAQCVFERVLVCV
jgi:hypothetical protein